MIFQSEVERRAVSQQYRDLASGTLLHGQICERLGRQWDCSWRTIERLVRGITYKEKT